jgi:hypothetical protein
MSPLLIQLLVTEALGFLSFALNGVSKSRPVLAAAIAKIVADASTLPAIIASGE